MFPQVGRGSSDPHENEDVVDCFLHFDGEGLEDSIVEPIRARGFRLGKLVNGLMEGIFVKESSKEAGVLLVFFG